MPETRRGPREVAVVIPVHEEERLLARCLSAVDVAVTRLATATGIRARVVAVLDACTDRSAEIAASFGVETVRVEERMVGAARARGVEHVSASAGAPASAVWIACTDADCVVPPRWLVQHHRQAAAGADAVVGQAWLDRADVPELVYRRWAERYRGGGPLRHIHGANLGFTLDAYRHVGGFRPVREHEDVELVARFVDAGMRLAAGAAVVTSGRLDGRTPGGFAGYLRDLRRDGSEAGRVDAPDGLGPEAVVDAPEHGLRPGRHPDARV